MCKIKLVVVEDNKDLCDIFCDYINENHSDKFEILGTANDGSEGLRLISEKMPDIALIDIVLPILDGIAILEKLHNMYLIDDICCIMLTAVSHDDITRKAMELGAQYYFLKPFDNESLVHRLIEINKNNETKKMSVLNNDSIYNTSVYNKRVPYANPEKYSAFMLQNIGIPANLTGYHYLRRAIVMCINDKSLLDGLTKILYPTLGKEFKTTGQRVERSIRHSIEKAWSDECAAKYYKALDRTPPEKIVKPSNGIFIMDIVDYYNTNFGDY